MIVVHLKLIETTMISLSLAIVALARPSPSPIFHFSLRPQPIPYIVNHHLDVQSLCFLPQSRCEPESVRSLHDGEVLRRRMSGGSSIDSQEGLQETSCRTIRCEIIRRAAAERGMPDLYDNTAM